MAERLSVEQDVVGSSPTSLPILFNSPFTRNFRLLYPHAGYTIDKI